MASDPVLIALDWGTTRLRAYLVSADGKALERRAGDDGIMAVPAGGFPAVLQRYAGGWRAAHPDLPVVMAGMVGSRNGWREAPYAACPADAAAIAAAMATVTLDDGGLATIVPGLITRNAGGIPDVMRGEETLILGAGIRNGTVVLPGTHSKWAWLRDGRIVGFATFMTGELYAAALEHTILGRLAEAPDDPAGFAHGAAQAGRPGGLTHLLFAARTLVLSGDMPGRQVRPFLSGLLIGAEITEALGLDAGGQERALVADGVLAERYRAGFDAAHVPVRIVDPETAFLAGIQRLGAVGRA